MSNPTLINLPPPQDPITPSDIPSRSGTPNSTATSMSELSTVAIKDGHRGHNPHHHNNPSSHSDAERADRISRLAGLERVTTARNNPTQSPFNPNHPNHQQYQQQQMQQPQTTPVQSYFDSTGNPAIHRERSTVGSASATGSVGGRTDLTNDDLDKMSEQSTQGGDFNFEDDASMGGMSEEGTPSLVAFGEGARTPARLSTYGGGTPVRTPRAELGRGDRKEGMEITSQDRMTSHIVEGAPASRGGEK